ncbi:MAG: tetratricopeptide repeat protein, partial [Myxococcota bacterium]|nr:tetratricopeptide repeat protein [Myxococcota bacterium]
VWDDRARDQARAAFAATGRAHGEETFARVDRQLTSYAAAWGQHRDRLCRLEAGPDDQTLSARRICLERRHDRLSAVAQVFRGADATVVDRAAASAYGLPSLEDCARASLAHSNPAGEEPAREAAAIRTELAHVEALLDAGRYQEASSRVDQVLQRAGRLGFEPLQAEALLMRGRVQLVEASPQTETTAAEAGYLAYSLGQDETALQAWLTAASFVARRNADAAGAERWLRLAGAALTRVGESDLLRAQLLMTRAGIHRVARRGQQGLLDALEAVRLHRQVLHPDDPLLAASLNEAGTLYEELGRYGEALALHQESLAQRERSLGPGHPLTSVSLTNLCATARSVGRLEEAQAACRRAVELREATLGPDHPDLANSLNSLGAVLSAQGRVEEALALYLRALAIRERVFKDSPQVAVQLNNIGAMLRRLGRFPEARDYLQRTVALCVRLEARCGAVRSGPYLHLGEIDLAEGRPQAALAQFQRSRTLTEQLHGPDHPDLAPALLGIGKAKLALGTPREAVPVLERAVELARRKPLPGRTEEAQFQLARALWTAGGDRPRARTLAEEAARSLDGQESQVRLQQEISGWLAARSR